MTQEQIIEELKRLKALNTTNTSEQQAEVDAEVSSLDATIEDYNEQIAALEAKIAAPNNYQYVNVHEEERTFEYELLEESFASQLEVLEREDNEYNTLQETATRIFEDYNLEIAELNNDIAMIERRLRKNDVAISRNIGIRLTEEELTDLNSSLESKRARVAECGEWKEKYVADLQNYGELITANNRKRAIVTAKQESLSRLKENELNRRKTVDNFKLRNDKDELARLKSGVAALNSRKEYITYDQNSEIDKLINSIQNTSKVEAEPQVENSVPINNTAVAPEPMINEDLGQNLINSYRSMDNDLDDQKLNLSDSNAIPLPASSLEFNDNEKAINKEETGMIVAPPSGMAVIDNDTPTVDPFIDVYSHSNDLDNEREAEVEEALKTLKEKKKTGFFKKHWKKFVAAGIAVLIILTAKGCSSMQNAGNVLDDGSKQDSYSDSDNGIQDENDNIADGLYDTSVENNTPINTPSTPDTPTNNDTPVTPTPSPVTPDPTPVTPDPTPVTPDPGPVTPDPTPVTPEPEKETVELEQGEKIADVNDIINGNISNDTVIEHGDEVGKTTSEGTELKDYTEDGKAVIEYDKEKDEEVTTENNRDQIIDNLEDFMGGELTFTDAGNQWLDEVSGKTR